jgi:hypothetical protein
MSTEPPANPEQEDLWTDENGDLRVFRDAAWVFYDEVPDGPFRQPPVADRDSPDDGD